MLELHTQYYPGHILLKNFINGVDTSLESQQTEQSQSTEKLFISSFNPSRVFTGTVCSCGVAGRVADHGAGVQWCRCYVRHGGSDRFHPVSLGPTCWPKVTDGVPAPEQTLW